jgi:hypothetical protein
LLIIGVEIFDYTNEGELLAKNKLRILTKLVFGFLVNGDKG